MGKTGKKRSKVQMPAGIRNKMMAAISMLMVSCIMLVSSTYAWFTLSTAPEITGITTNVGANGNLEMMLLNADSYASTDDNLGVDSKVGDSSAKQGTKLSNVTWGNLVDLSDTSYGLSSVTLMPAKLELTNATDFVVTGDILNTPTYGKDGRVISVENPAMTGSFNAGGSWIYDSAAVGVRALGTSSGTTLRLSEYNTALYNTSSYGAKAQGQAQISLKENAQALADLLIEKALKEESHSIKYLTSIESIITGTKTANAHIKTMIQNALLAWNLSDEGAKKDGQKIDLSDEQVETIKSTIMSSSFDLSSIPSEIDVPESITSLINTYKATETAVSSAESKLNTLKEAVEQNNKTSVTWSEISEPLNLLVDTNKVAISSKNYTLEDYSSGKASMEDLANAILDDLASGLPITMLPNSGVYYNIAKVCGAYSVTGTVHVTYGNILNNREVDFIMTQQVEGSVLVKDAITHIQNNGKAPSVSVGGNATIALSDTYGYMLDFGFRTNAAGSNLLLQTAEKQRVYSSGEDASKSAATQGGGSYMEFTTADPLTFSETEMRALMSAIRVAFVQPISGTTGTTTYSLLALGGLDIEASDPNNEGIITYTGGTASDTDSDTVNDTVKADLVLFDYTYSATENTLVKGNKRVTSTATEGEGGTEGTTTSTPVTTITALTQNVASKVSVIVYLDGTIVDNTMVANAQNSMIGKLNLQFSSDATLVPMDNAGMKSGGQKATDAPAPEYGQPVTFGTQTVTYNGETYTVELENGYSLYEASDGYKYYKEDTSDTYVLIDTNNYLSLRNCPAFKVIKTTVAVTGVTLDNTSLTMTVGGTTETLKATVTPDNATDKVVTWSSSAEDVATVQNGVVTAVSAGNAIITATAGDQSATCAVTVNAASTGGETQTPDEETQTP